MLRGALNKDYIRRGEYKMSITQNQLLAAIKEVNTSQAQVGDVISYTITLTNVSNEPITNICLTDIIDKSLEVEENSIGINGVVSANQTLTNLQLPDLMPQEQSTVEFNAIVRRIPISLDSKIRENAYIRFIQNGQVYESRATTATTLITDNQVIGPVVICLAPHKSEAVLGDKIKYKAVIRQLPGQNIKSAYLSIVLDENLQYIAGTLMIDGCLIGDQIEHLMIGLECNHINVTFEAQVIGVPTTIRALTSAQVVLQYASALTPLAVSNEALVEVLPPILYYSYNIKMPCTKKVNIVVSNVGVMPNYQACSNYEYELKFIVLLEQDRQSIEAIKQSVPIHYPYSEETQISIWGQQYGEEIKVNIFLMN